VVLQSPKIAKSSGISSLLSNESCVYLYVAVGGFRVDSPNVHNSNKIGVSSSSLSLPIEPSEDSNDA